MLFRSLIEAAKKKPGEISYAATGRGRITHLTMELMQNMTGAKLQLVPYSGGPAQAMNDITTGRVGLVLDGYASLAGSLQGNVIKGLAHSGLERLKEFPDMPTVAETLPGFQSGGWNVIIAPVGTPDAIVRKVSADMRKVLDEAEVRAKLANLGAFVRHFTPEELATFTQQEQKTWRPILEQVAKEVQ